MQASNSISKIDIVRDNVPNYLRRCLDWKQIDFEQTFTQVLYLLYSPSKVYKMTAWHSQTRGKWGRDDPALIMLIITLLCVVSFFNSLILGGDSFGLLFIVKQMFKSIFFFFLFGLLLSSFYWLVANK